MDRQLLSRATDSSEAPTPGYMYVDLAKQATSNPATCQDMATYLTRRLQNKNNPNIKFKCCKVIAKLADQVPRNQFRRALAQNAIAVSAIKEAINFRGPLDAVQGDERNARVRTAAREALDAVYREAPSSSQPVSQGHMSASYGASPHGGGGAYNGVGGGGEAPGGAYNGAPSRMQGIGNPQFSDPRLDPRYNGTGNTTIKDVAKEAGEVILGMIKDPLAKNVGNPGVNQGHSGSLPGYGGGGNYGGSYGGPPGRAETIRQTGGEWTMASNRGPNAVQSDPYYKERDTKYQWAQKSGGVGSGGVGGSWGAPAPAASSHQHQTAPSASINHVNPSAGFGGSGGGGTAAQDGTYEKNMIHELCPPGGMKAVPPPDKLANFTRAIPSLSPDLVCPVLLDCLEEGQPWIIRAKALCVMETCIQNGDRPGEGGGIFNPYQDFFHACQEEIAPMANHPRAAIKAPASRVMALLGIAAPTGAASAGAAPPQQAPAAPAPNLLDFDDEPATSAPSPAPAQVHAPPTVASPPAQPAVASANSNMFGGMQVKATTAAPVATPAAAPAENLLDFQPVPAPTPVAAAVATGGNNVAPSSMFAEMNIKSKDSESEKKSDDDIKPTSAADDLQSFATPGGGGGSAFGFMNGDATGAPAAREPESFDPLKNESPTNTPKKMMNISPDQMQAMAYQQMMMHQQMQQMQMAMAVQQRGGLMAPFPMAAGGSPQFNMQQQQQQHRQSTGGGAVNSGFSFMDAPKPARKDDKKFDFVMDEMKTGTKK